MSSFCVDSKEVHSVNIENVNVRFPKSPYECQKEYMTCVIRTLNSSQNALLESPTGTGYVVLSDHDIIFTYFYFE